MIGDDGSFFSLEKHLASNRFYAPIKTYIETNVGAAIMSIRKDNFFRVAHLVNGNRAEQRYNFLLAKENHEIPIEHEYITTINVSSESYPEDIFIFLDKS